MALATGVVTQHFPMRNRRLAPYRSLCQRLISQHSPQPRSESSPCGTCSLRSRPAAPAPAFKIVQHHSRGAVAPELRVYCDAAAAGDEFEVSRMA